MGNCENLHETQFRKSFRYWQKKDDYCKGSKLFSKDDEKELDLLQEELLHYYRDILPPEISLTFTRYFDERTTKTECQEFFNEQELQVRRRTSENIFTHVSAGGKIGVGVKFHHLRQNAKLNEVSKKTKTTTAVVSTTCYNNLKKFEVKPVLDEINFLKTAKKIHSATNPHDRYKALNETIHRIRKFEKNPMSIPIVPFHCGGSFTIDAIAESAEETEQVVLLQSQAQKN